MFGLRSHSAEQLRSGLVHGKPARAVAVVRREGAAVPQLVHARFEAHTTGEHGDRATQALLAAVPKRRCPIAAVLDAAEYQIVATEPLDLPQDELREAVRWRIRDQSSVPADSAALDVFSLPAARGSNVSLQVVVAPPASVQALKNITAAASRELDIIDIQELALRNLMALLPQDQVGCAFVFLGRSAINILISRAGVLYVARRIDAGMRNGSAHLALELQRSLQYYESQFDQAPIGEVIVGPDNDEARALVPEITDASGLRVQVLDLSTIVQLADGLPPVSQPELLLAIGAALRPRSGSEAP
jgi:MSHA biogenesis protein MshI